jgi:choline-glycine betaine transporter
VVMGTLSQRGSIEPSRGVVIFWGTLMGAIGAIMLLVGGGGDAALSGIQKLTIITAAPFALIMVLLCISLAKELRSDPMVHRDDRTREKVERAIEYGTARYGEHFHIRIEPKSPKDP